MAKSEEKTRQIVARFVDTVLSGKIVLAEDDAGNFTVTPGTAEENAIDPKRETLTPTAEEISKARLAYIRAFGDGALDVVEGDDDDNPLIQGLAKIYALERQYPDVGLLLGNLDLDAPRGFGAIDVGMPNDPTYGHVVLDPEEFLELALAGEIALNEQGYPDYTGTEHLRG